MGPQDLGLMDERASSSYSTKRCMLLNSPSPMQIILILYFLLFWKSNYLLGPCRWCKKDCVCHCGLCGAHRDWVKPLVCIYRIPEWFGLGEILKTTLFSMAECFFEGFLGALFPSLQECIALQFCCIDILPEGPKLFMWFFMALVTINNIEIWFFQKPRAAQNKLEVLI